MSPLLRLIAIKSLNFDFGENCRPNEEGVGAEGEWFFSPKKGFQGHSTIEIEGSSVIDKVKVAISVQSRNLSGNLPNNQYMQNGSA